MLEKKYDYGKLGLKVGLEIHQQLKTKKKLFCRCLNEMLGTKEPDFMITRTFRPVLGEMGVFDEGMLLEFEKGMTVAYEGYNSNTCTYEYDDTPPFHCDAEAMDVAWEIASLLKMNLIEELHVCRKNYLDGSVPAGFQRTMIVAKDGQYPVSDSKNIHIDILCLEEDAARKIKTEERTVFYRLDRLGIPLVEVTTKPDINDPHEAREAAFRLGLLLRSTGKVHKVIGSIRQDINVSIKVGTRIEIKGVQKLDWIPILIDHEIERQIKLVEIKKELATRGGSVDEIIAQEPQDLSGGFGKTSCKMVATSLKKGEKVLGIKVPKFAGLLGKEVQYNRRLGTEVSDRVKVITGLKGIIHSDEDIPKYGFSSEELSTIREKLHIQDEDAFIMVLGPKEVTARAMVQVKNRLEDAFQGVPPETRRALENGNTEFMRKLQGGARLYPDTDSTAIPIDLKRVKEIQANLKGYPWDMKEQIAMQYGISQDFVQKLILSGDVDIFLEIVKIDPKFATLAATTLLETVTALRREGKPVENLDTPHFLELFTLLNEGKLGKEAFQDVLGAIAESPDEKITKIVGKTVGKAVGDEDLAKIIEEAIMQDQEIIKSSGSRAFGAVMGDVMKNVRGKIDGKKVSTMLKEKLDKFLKEGGK
ncbi:MAG: aspartyl-tRNA(Asn) amidotransferase, B subunit [Promethearchaeota archaeon CR_4]|nr:MAG: aspartyl-tRNA(Asn) amidotransferase, B subunit [Candidatus Lokiarchaeota archaeon CR_4]